MSLHILNIIHVSISIIFSVIMLFEVRSYTMIYDSYFLKYPYKRLFLFISVNPSTSYEYYELVDFKYNVHVHCWISCIVASVF